MGNKKDQELSPELSGETQGTDFEKNLKDLEQIVTALESGKLGLEDGLKKFENGVKLYKKCKEFLSQAEKKISLLSEDLKEEELDISNEK
jgi:exodeoxyribonuclease VII small subunit